MKKTFLTIALALSIFTASQAQSEKYAGAMQANLEKFGAAKTPEEFATTEATFERIANAEKTQWLPYYYAAQLKTLMSFNAKTDEKDALTDQALALLDKAELIEKNNSEILVIKSMANTAKMLVNPQQRFMSFGMKASALLEEAKKLDATNPRPYVLQAMNLKNTPKQFGGGCEVAKPIAQKAVELSATFKPKGAFYPTWGKQQIDSVLSCQ